MSLNSKREEERMKKVDPKKAQQAERLGMGLGSRRYATKIMLKIYWMLEALFDNFIFILSLNGH